MILQRVYPNKSSGGVMGHLCFKSYIWAIASTCAVELSKPPRSFVLLRSFSKSKDGKDGFESNFGTFSFLVEYANLLV